MVSRPGGTLINGGGWVDSPSRETQVERNMFLIKFPPFLIIQKNTYEPATADPNPSPSPITFTSTPFTLGREVWRTLCPHPG